MSVPSVSAVSERLTRHERLRHRKDFLRCYRQGTRRHGPLASLYVAPSPTGLTRLGITASRKVGKSVVRHRLRRRVREIFRRWDGRRGLPSVDIVVHLRPPAAQAGFDSLRSELVSRLEWVGRRRGER